MSRWSLGTEYAAALAGAGFSRHLRAGATGAGPEVYRRPVRARWCLEARLGEGRHGFVDVGLTLEPRGGILVGPIHRSLSPAALALALPHIVASLEALAQAAESLRCPDCNSGEALQEGPDGPFLACSQPRSGRRPFDTTVQICRRNLVMGALIVYRDPG
jgi:hypothetical protein